MYSCLGNPMDCSPPGSSVHGVAKDLDMAERLNNKNNKIREWSSLEVILFLPYPITTIVMSITNLISFSNNNNKAQY